MAVKSDEIISRIDLRTIKTGSVAIKKGYLLELDGGEVTELQSAATRPDRIALQDGAAGEKIKTAPLCNGDVIEVFFGGTVAALADVRPDGTTPYKVSAITDDASGTTRAYSLGRGEVAAVDGNLKTIEINVQALEV